MCLLFAGNHNLGQSRGIVAYHFAFVEQISVYQFSFGAETAFDRIIVKSDLNCAFGSIKFRLSIADWPIVDEYIIKVNLRCIAVHHLEMLPSAVSISFAGLRHKIADENLDCR